jgi:hypothetical protein
MNQHTRYFNSSSPMLRIVFFMLRRIVEVNKLVSPFSFKSIQTLFCTFDQASSRCYQQQCRKVLIIKKTTLFFSLLFESMSLNNLSIFFSTSWSLDNLVNQRFLQDLSTTLSIKCSSINEYWAISGI